MRKGNTTISTSELLRTPPGPLYRWLGDGIFSWTVFILGMAVIVSTILMAIVLYLDGAEAFSRFGIWGFLRGRVWDPGSSFVFGSLPFLFGTVITSVVSLLIAFVPAVAVALFTAEYSPRWLSQIIENLINLIAAIPSVIVGLWGVFVLAPWLRGTIYTPVYLWTLDNAPSLLPILGNPIGYGMATATLVLAVMIIPYTTALTVDALRLVPREQREAAYALGATKWEVIKMAIIPYARGGILAGAMLSFGRAIGETMAVAMLIGNRNTLPFSIIGPASTMPSVIVNEFREAVGNLHLSSLMAVGFYLFLVSLAVNLVAAHIQRKFSFTGGRAV
ncbi:phosphate ABC transporter permease subunit PstC [Chitinispirillales bacterium ANBcel5]|uniref:phosphate ABC transporter permease subunit PstC n=1 Tax=Cellulosispirillum alkaliphilum TaxID=3039283 RepID=UPI002A57F8AA|nr:phosphate ABC transporter permease subunit PstC [Chitinispirillales bacterium ANBcel5]